MTKTKIVKVKDGECVSYLQDHMYETIIEQNPVLTLEELADLCDQEAESKNHHGFAGMHKILAIILFRHSGRELATKRNGLMKGVKPNGNC